MRTWLCILCLTASWVLPGCGQRTPESHAPAASASAPTASAKSVGSSSADLLASATPVAAPVGGLGTSARQQDAHNYVLTLAEEAAVPSRERYAPIIEHQFVAAADEPVSTFSIDVDTASYANLRRFLQLGQRPPVDAVRVEELVNYFRYDYQPPSGGAPFAAHLEVAGCPWQPRHRLAKIGLKGRDVPAGARPPCNLVFLIDVSGSMNHPLKLPLVKHALQLLVDQLGEADHIALTVYAGAAGMPLPPTSASRKGEILAALQRLQAGGSTHGSLGIRLAYDVARKHFVPGGLNRVILCTDGDFNVGVTSDHELEELIASEAKSGVFLNVLGFGMGNLQDAKLERIADRGNGQYAYIDSLEEARRTLVEHIQGTLVTIAKDVKIQVEFDPQRVAGYRLVGYENRRLANEDFANDAKDAGEIGAGHAVTAFYEIIPAAEVPPPGEAEFLKLRLRYKAPDSDESRLAEFAGVDPGRTFEAASTDFRFAAAVAMFGMLLRNSETSGAASWPLVETVARGSLGDDPRGERREFLSLVGTARSLLGGSTGAASVETSRR